MLQNPSTTPHGKPFVDLPDFPNPHRGDEITAYLSPLSAPEPARAVIGVAVQCDQLVSQLRRLSSRPHAHVDLDRLRLVELHIKAARAFADNCFADVSPAAPSAETARNLVFAPIEAQLDLLS